MNHAGLGGIGTGALTFTALLFAFAAPSPAAQVSLAAAGKTAKAKIKSLSSYEQLTRTGTAGPLRGGGCKRLRAGRASCTSYRTTYRPCASAARQQPDCDPLTRTWKLTLAKARSGKLRVARIHTSDRHGYAGPCSGGPCVNGEQVSGGNSIAGAARAAVLSHSSFTVIVPTDPGGARLINHSCSGVGGGQSECLLYRVVGTPCQLSGGTQPGQVCAQVVVYRSWVARVTQDPQDAQQFTATVLRYWDAAVPPTS
jgi:hypothetical protein